MMSCLNETEFDIDKTVMYPAGVLTDRNSDFYTLSCKPAALQHLDFVPKISLKQRLHPKAYFKYINAISSGWNYTHIYMYLLDKKKS